MRKNVNQTYVEGWLYESKLEARVTGENSKNPGTPFIMGTIDIATDNAITNIVSVHYTYVTATTAKGAANNTYTILNDIINGKYKSVMAHGKENATKFRIDSTIGLNEFYSSRNGAEELISAKRNEGGFIHTVDVLNEDENARSKFTADMVITSVSRVEADEEKKMPEKATVRGCIFDFRNAILPVEFIATDPRAMDYFESLDASAKNPVYTKLWGRQISQTVVREIREESAFGDDSVREVRNTRKEWLITGAARETYEFDTSETITRAELTKAMSDRETYLATIKARQDEYRASQTNTASANNFDKNTEFKF